MDAQSVAKQRINELISNYQQDDNQMTRYYINILNFVKAHMVDFFNRYAQDNSLTTQEVSQSVSSWDIEQWKQVLTDVGYDEFSPEAKKRAQGVTALAAISVLGMISAIPKLGLIAITDNNIKIAAKRIQTDADQQIQHLSRRIQRAKFVDKVMKDGHSAITDPKTVEIWSNNLWTDTSTMAGQVQTAVNQHIRHGMKLNDLNQMLTKHDNPAQFNPDQSIADRMKQSQFNARRIIRTESSRIVNQTNYATYMQVGVKKVRLATEPGVCDACLALQAEGPWLISDAPSIPDDTHPNCNCYLIPDDDDEDTMKYTVNPNDYRKAA